MPTTRIHPHGWRELRRGADAGGAGERLALARQRELDTLATLAEALDEGFAIYHGVHWTRLADDGAIFDDIDFIVVGPGGRILLVEQAPGFLSEGPYGLARRRGGRDIVVASRLAETRAAFAGRLRRALEGVPSPEVDVLFHCPDHTVRDAGSAGLPPERIVDARQRERLPAIVRALLADGEPMPAPAAEKLHRFLADLLDLVPDTDALVDAAGALTTRLTGGLAEWARRLDFAPFRLRVAGTAGAGKTQLALAVFRDALAARRRPLYVCYNRPLADHVAATVAALDDGGTGVVATYHQLADRVARQRGRTPDFAAPDAFRRLEAELADFAPDAAWQFDELIVDEGQDFDPAWGEILLRLLRPEGRAWWLEDPQQNLYGRAPFRPPGWVELRAGTNFRSTRAIIAFVAALGVADAVAGGPIDGDPVEILAYDDEEGLVEQTKRAIGLCIAAGFRRERIAVLSCRGRQSSRLASRSRLGPYALRSFSGRYDLLGSPIQSAGDIAFDSVLRFKGQAAPAVVLAEADFETLDEAARRRLFVGATRAALKLVVVAAQRTADALAARCRS